MDTPSIRPTLATGLAGAVTLIAFAAIAGALLIEHVGGYKPCPLCLEERYAYYLALPLGLAAVWLLRSGRPAVAAGLLGLIALAFLANAVLGGYHAGVEWGWWPGPTDCSGGEGFTIDAGSLLDELGQTRVIRCDKPALTVLWLSLAAWNAVISLGLSGLAALTGMCAWGDSRRRA